MNNTSSFPCNLIIQFPLSGIIELFCSNRTTRSHAVHHIVPSTSSSLYPTMYCHSAKKLYKDQLDKKPEPEENHWEITEELNYRPGLFSHQQQNRQFHAIPPWAAKRHDEQYIWYTRLGATILHAKTCSYCGAALFLSFNSNHKSLPLDGRCIPSHHGILLAPPDQTESHQLVWNKLFFLERHFIIIVVAAVRKFSLDTRQRRMMIMEVHQNMNYATSEFPGGQTRCRRRIYMFLFQ